MEVKKVPFLLLADKQVVERGDEFKNCPVSIQGVSGVNKKRGLCNDLGLINVNNCSRSSATFLVRRV